MSTITREFTKEQLIEDLKSSTQNASGMFEISEDTICALMSMIYAAPQLPQPAVPDIATVETTYPDVQTNWQDAKMYAEGWNAYRAAMLQSFGNSEQLNSPVIPDGWVACSEQMPEDEQEVIVQNKMGYRYVSYFDEHSGLFFDMRGGNQMNCIEHIFVTHWMPLPAAPLQEVKP